MGGDGGSEYFVAFDPDICVPGCGERGSEVEVCNIDSEPMFSFRNSGL